MLSSAGLVLSTTGSIGPRSFPWPRLGVTMFLPEEVATVWSKRCADQSDLLVLWPYFAEEMTLGFDVLHWAHQRPFHARYAAVAKNWSPSGVCPRKLVFRHVWRDEDPGVTWGRGGERSQAFRRIPDETAK